MENEQNAMAYENIRLQDTITLARQQLDKARNQNEETKESIIQAKKELREDTAHSIGNLYSSEDFEALAELSQYLNPVTDKITAYEETEHKIRLLEKLIKSPYFARINFRFDNEAICMPPASADESDYEQIYIGRTSLKKNEYCEMLVYDWRSPIAGIFYRFATGPAYYDAPAGRITGNVNLKRQYEIKDSVLEYYFDADIQIMDEFLRKLLSQNTSPQMKAIVETIQKEQDLVIRDMENDLMMVQGTAGSGKTSIALHRAAYLMYQGLSSKLHANNILIISPNTLFGQYISQVLPELGEESVDSVIFDEMAAKILGRGNIQSKNQFLEKLLSVSGSRKIMKNCIAFKTSPRFMEILNLFIRDLPDKWIHFEDVYYSNHFIIGKAKMKEKISGRKETPLGIKLKQLEDFILELIPQKINTRLDSSEISLIKNELQSFTILNTLNLYRKLFSDKVYFQSLANNMELPECVDDIFRITNKNLVSDYINYDDAIALTYLHLKLNGSTKYKNIKQVVIDESQDYYPLHYEIFGLLFPYSKFTILGDINQTLEKQEDYTIYDQIARILHKKKTSLITMDKSFRCTNEILTYSSSLIRQDLQIKSFNRNGDEPKLHQAENQVLLKEYIRSEIKYCLEKGYQSIGLICKTQKNAYALFRLLKDSFNICLIQDDCTADLQGVFIIPVYMSKGLEFDAVLLCDADTRNYRSEDDRNLLYIACTRALHRLNLFCTGEVSPLLP